MGPLDLPSFALGAIAALGLVLLIGLLRRDMDPTRTSGNAIASSRRGFPLARRTAPQRPALMGPSQLVSDLVRQGRKIDAIRVYREQTGAGLKEAKEAVDALETRISSRRR